jgi:molybdopterin converting factor small subunit
MAASPPPANHFTILYFAAANTLTKKNSEFLPAPLQLSSLFDTLEQKYPGIKDKVLSSCALTVNLEYVDLEDNATGGGALIKEGDEVAIIPPVSSG